MESIALTLFLINALQGLAMYFMKVAHDNTKERLTSHQQSIDEIKDKYYKKEEFREFKEELFNRLDKMENSFDRRFQEMNK